MSANACSEPRRGIGVAVALGAALILAPVPLGANRPLAWTLLGAVLGALLVAWALLGGQGWPRRVWVLAAGWISVVAWALVQSAPWTPSSWHHPLWAEAGLPTGAVAVDPALAVEGALRLLAYGAAFLLAVAVGRDVAVARGLVRAMAAGAAAVALYGLVVYLGGFGSILWWDKWAYHDSLTATFVNRNAAATCFGFGLLCSGALMLERRAARLFPASAAFLCAAALLLTQSRAGVAVSLVGIAVLVGAMVVVRRPSARLLVRGGLAAGAALVLLVAAAGQGVGARLLATDLGDTDRAPVHAATVRAIAEFPWTGQGLGGFNRAFPAHRPAELDQHWDKAHSSYLENTFELGLPAAVTLYATLAAAAGMLVGGLRRRRRHRAYPALGLAALILAAVHGAVDFTLQMPANALWLAALVGLGVAQSMPTRRATAARASGSADRARR